MEWILNLDVAQVDVLLDFEVDVFKDVDVQDGFGLQVVVVNVAKLMKIM